MNFPNIPSVFQFSSFSSSLPREAEKPATLPTLESCGKDLHLYAERLDKHFGNNAAGLYEQMAAQGDDVKKAILDQSKSLRAYLDISNPNTLRKKFQSHKATTIPPEQAPDALATAAVLLSSPVKAARALDRLKECLVGSKNTLYQESFEKALDTLKRNGNNLGSGALRDKADSVLEMLKGRLAGTESAQILETIAPDDLPSNQAAPTHSSQKKNNTGNNVIFNRFRKFGRENEKSAAPSQQPNVNSSKTPEQLIVDLEDEGWTQQKFIELKSKINECLNGGSINQIRIANTKVGDLNKKYSDACGPISITDDVCKARFREIAQKIVEKYETGPGRTVPLDDTASKAPPEIDARHANHASDLKSLREASIQDVVEKLKSEKNRVLFAIKNDLFKCINAQGLGAVNVEEACKKFNQEHEKILGVKLDRASMAKAESLLAEISILTQDRTSPKTTAERPGGRLNMSGKALESLKHIDREIASFFEAIYYRPDMIDACISVFNNNCNAIFGKSLNVKSVTDVKNFAELIDRNIVIESYKALSNNNYNGAEIIIEILADRKRPLEEFKKMEAEIDKFTRDVFSNPEKESECIRAFNKNWQKHWPIPLEFKSLEEIHELAEMLDTSIQVEKTVEKVNSSPLDLSAKFTNKLRLCALALDSGDEGMIKKSFEKIKDEYKQLFEVEINPDDEATRNWTKASVSRLLANAHSLTPADQIVDVLFRNTEGTLNLAEARYMADLLQTAIKETFDGNPEPLQRFNARYSQPGQMVSLTSSLQAEVVFEKLKERMRNDSRVRELEEAVTDSHFHQKPGYLENEDGKQDLYQRTPKDMVKKLWPEAVNKDELLKLTRALHLSLKGNSPGEKQGALDDYNANFRGKIGVNLDAILWKMTTIRSSDDPLYTDEDRDANAKLAQQEGWFLDLLAELEHMGKQSEQNADNKTRETQRPKEVAKVIADAIKVQIEERFQADATAKRKIGGELSLIAQLMLRADDDSMWVKFKARNPWLTSPEVHDALALRLALNAVGRVYKDPSTTTS